MNTIKAIGLCVFSIQMFAGCLGMNDAVREENNEQQDLRAIVRMEYYPGRVAVSKDISFFHALFPVEQMSNPVYLIGNINDDDYVHTLWECNAIRIAKSDFRAYISVYLNLDGADEKTQEIAYSKKLDINAASQLPIVKISYGTHINHYTYPKNQDELYDDLRGDLSFHIPWFIMRHIWGQEFHPSNF